MKPKTLKRELFTKAGHAVYHYIPPVFLDEDEIPSDELLARLGIASWSVKSKVKTVRQGRKIWLVNLLSDA